MAVNMTLNDKTLSDWFTLARGHFNALSFVLKKSGFFRSFFIPGDSGEK